jgi:hypothetical protein
MFDFIFLCLLFFGDKNIFGDNIRGKNQVIKYFEFFFV